MAIYHKSVRYRLHKIEVGAYRPERKGMNCTFDDYDFINNEVTVHYSCCDDPYIAPDERCTIDDIEEEITRMGPRIVKETRIPYKLPFHLGTKTILDSHLLDGQYDYLRSKAVMKHELNLPKIELKEINKFYEESGGKPLKNSKVTVGEIIE